MESYLRNLIIYFIFYLQFKLVLFNNGNKIYKLKKINLLMNSGGKLWLSKNLNYIKFNLVVDMV